MQDIRWKQRLNSFENAFNNFLIVHEALNKNPDNLINKMAMIQAFEMVFELSWKTLKDYLTFQGSKVKFVRDVIKEAFATDIIDNGDAWADMLEDRNSTVHEYNEKESNKIIDKINNVYFNEIKQVYEYLKGRIDE